MGIKLNNYRKTPDQYNAIILECNAKGIYANDETDVVELFEKFQNIDETHILNVVKKTLARNSNETKKEVSKEQNQESAYVESVVKKALNKNE